MGNLPQNCVPKPRRRGCRGYTGGSPAPMKIAFLNPFRNAAENQVFESMAVAAKRIGHELVQCTNSMQVEAESPDFVLAMASPQPKLNDIAHYGIIHEPRNLFLTERKRYSGILTRDGYLTISETLAGFIRDLTFAVGRPQEPGFFFTTCQRQDVDTDVLRLARSRKLKITYFGTNWDVGRAEVIRELAQHDGVTVFGPEGTWQDLPAKSKGGTLPFDGESVQRAYTERGIGLCLLSDDHYREGIMSNRIFEISSVGAVVICPDVPWVRHHFGDSVYYVDQWLPQKHLVQQILLRRKEIEMNPAVAAEKAKQARKIFEERFAAEVLLANAVAHHSQMSARRMEELGRAAAATPLISVVICCGSGPLAAIERSVDSVARQSYGRFQVLLVRKGELDLGSLLATSTARIESVSVIDVDPDDPGSGLWTGLAAVSGEYFAVLDADCWYFSDHFEKLFRPLGAGSRARFLAYSGAVRHDATPRDRGEEDCRSLTHFGLTDGNGELMPHSFVASSDLLHEIRVPAPERGTAHATYLLLALLDRVEHPHFSYSATAVYERDCRKNPELFDGELSAHVRMHARYGRRLQVMDGFAALSAYWKQRPERDRYAELPNLAPALRNGKLSVLSILPAELTKRAAVSINVGRSRFHAGSKAIDASGGKCHVQTPPQPWAYGVELALDIPRGCKGSGLICLQAQVTGGPVGVGVLNLAETDFLFRVPLYESEQVQLVHLPVEDLGAVGRLVVQNWEMEGGGAVRIAEIEVIREVGHAI